MLADIFVRIIPKFLRFIRLNVFIQIILILSYPLISIGRNERSECILDQAEACFNSLFESMPICLGSELNFRCHHFKILDACFRKSSIMCSPEAIGQIAKAAHRRKLVSCVRQTSKQYRNTQTRRKVPPAILRNHPPTELQFISLFGYLQSQCNTKLVENCTNHEYKTMLTTCEADIRHKSGLANSDYDRQRLLKIKLDTSSQLLQIAETQREDECLIIRSALTDIFQIHQKYCFHTVVTKCMCERMNFQYFCDIECATLDSSGLPLDNRVSWENFKGKLVGGANNNTFSIKSSIILTFLYFIIINRILLNR